MEVKTFYHQDTFTFSYIVFDIKTKDAVVLDPVVDYEPGSSTISYGYMQDLIQFIEQQDLNLHFILDTHIHADHLSGCSYLQEKFPEAKRCISKQVIIVQKTFSKIYNLESLKTDGSQFDCLLEDNQILEAGNMSIKVIHTPGHTPACLSLLIEDCLFTGDALFIPDSGTGRCDFPDGSAKNLYHSIHEKIYNLPDHIKVFVGHDYQPAGRPLKWQTTISESKKENIQLKADTSEKEFVEYRNSRDKLLKAPKLLLPSIQINLEAGHLPKPEDNFVSYLKIPVKIEKDPQS